MRQTLTLAAPLPLTLLAACATTHGPAPSVRDVGPDTLAATEAYPAIIAAINEGESTEQAFAIASGTDEGETGSRAVSPAERDDAAEVAWTVAAEDEPRNSSVLRLENDGALVVLEMPNRERDVVTRFEPPFVHFPASLTRGEPFTQELRMLIADFDDPDTITRRGDSASTITLLGGVDVMSDDVRTTALVVRAELVSTIGPAKVNRTTDRWFIPQRGYVGERYTEVVRIFGIQSDKREQEIWREGVEPIEGESGAGNADEG